MLFFLNVNKKGFFKFFLFVFYIHPRGQQPGKNSCYLVQIFKCLVCSPKNCLNSPDLNMFKMSAMLTKLGILDLKLHITWYDPERLTFNFFTISQLADLNADNCKSKHILFF